MSERPEISDTTDGPLGRQFTVHFLPGQRFPDHRNNAKVVITVVSGSGEITLGDDAPKRLSVGDVVRIDPRVLHALECTTEAMEVQVTLIAACCDCC